MSTRPTIIDVPLRKAVEHLTEANGVSFSQVQSVVLQVMVFSQNDAVGGVRLRAGGEVTL